MLVITQDNFIPYNQIKNHQTNVVVFQELFSQQIIEKVKKNFSTQTKIKETYNSLIEGVSLLTDRIYTKVKPEYNSTTAVIITEQSCSENSSSKNPSSKIKIGSVIFYPANYTQEKEKGIFLYEDYITPQLFSKIENRLKYSKKIKKQLQPFDKLPRWKQCIQSKLDLEFLGRGSYANVFLDKKSENPYAIKISKIKEDAVNTNRTSKLSAWHEVYILQKVIRPILEKKICPNLPLIIDYFTCDSCSLTIDGEKINTPTITTIVELANGNLKDFLNTSPSQEEIYSALFQCMAGIHAIQQYGQIMNFDVKKENVLYYNIVPGGYWHYIVNGTDFYVPNFGKLFILNDFGISRSMSTNFKMSRTKNEKTVRLGSRFATIKNGKFVPISVESQPDHSGKTISPVKITWYNQSEPSQGAEFRMNRKGKILPTSNIDLNQPNITPPFEFYNDTQDGIRMFIGGKRTTQRGKHKKLPCIKKEFVAQLKPYLGKGESMKDYRFSEDPCQVVASYFIQDFFRKYTTFSTVQKNSIETYKMS